MKQYYYSEICRLRTKFAVNWLCELFGISRSGYYKWVKRKGSVNQYQKSQQILDELVMDIHKKHTTSGYRSINSRILHNTGWIICDISVLKSMQRLHIRAAGRRKKYPRAGGPEHTRFPNLLNRQFNADTPMSKVVTDITQFVYNGICYHFTCFLDLFNNEILEWNVGQTETLDLIMPPLRTLLQRKKMSTKDPLLLHSDQGCQYSSAGLVSLLAQYNVSQSMSRAGTPHDNAVIESVFGWFKEFLRYEYLKRNSMPISDILHEAVYEFNHFRPSHKLKYKSPVQFRIEQGFV